MHPPQQIQPLFLLPQQCRLLVLCSLNHTPSLEGGEALPQQSGGGRSEDAVLESQQWGERASGKMV